jgi:LysM repeat protein
MYIQSTLTSYPASRSTTNKRITLHINPVRVLFALLITILFTFAAIISAHAGDSMIQGKSDSRSSAHSVVIESGDTLWSIAAANKGAKQDIRAYIEEIKDVNKLGTSSLKQGQVIKLPD